MDMEAKGPVEIELDELPDLAEVELSSQTNGDQKAIGFVGAIDRRPSRVLRWMFRFLGAILSLAIGVWAWDFVTGLLQRSPVLGGIAAALVGTFVLLLLALGLREIAAISRLGRIEGIRTDAEAALADGETESAKAVVDRLNRFYAGRSDVSWGSNRMKSQIDGFVDGGDILFAAEREILAPLDARALSEVEAAAARVATITALVPVALADVVTALYSNIAMIRRIAEIYGGRSGSLGAWRLTRAVIAHLAATGAVAVGDDLIGSTLGGGVLSKLSRRFGEGLINGALTARVGIAAMELCRPLPFKALKKPRVSTTISRALTGLFTKETG